MDRRKFIGNLGAFSSLFIINPLKIDASAKQGKLSFKSTDENRRVECDLAIIGGGTGGFSAAMAALRNGLTVVMTEETDWIGGQLTQQGVPPDEHVWVNDFGSTSFYRKYREKVREYYRENYPLKDKVKNERKFNPGNATVSEISHEPKVSLQVLENMMAPYSSSGRLLILKNTKAIKARVKNNKVLSVEVQNHKTKQTKEIIADYFVDATELGDLLPLTGTEYITGSEAKSDTGELHAGDNFNPNNNQAFTTCFAIDYRKGEDWIIQKPEEYDFWKNYVPELEKPWSGKLLDLKYSDPGTLEPKELGFNPNGKAMDDKLNLWIYRRIIDKNNFETDLYNGDITLVNYPQNDYMLGNIVDKNEREVKYHIERSKQLSLSLLYWLQTEAPRPDGGKGWKGLRLRNDVMGTQDGLAKYPYIREARRIKSLFRITEAHVGRTQRAEIMGSTLEEAKAKHFWDSVGIGYYHIDLHPSSEGDNYIDFGSLPFQIPLGAMIPERVVNLFPVSKNIGTTHITNGCYRLHPVEWSIGESVGMFVRYLMDLNKTPQEVYKNKPLVKNFQTMVKKQGVDIEWPYDKM